MYLHSSDKARVPQIVHCASELPKLSTDFESYALPSTSKADDFLSIRKHHEDNISLRNRFTKDVKLVTSCFTINPSIILLFKLLCIMYYFLFHN